MDVLVVVALTAPSVRQIYNLTGLTDAAQCPERLGKHNPLLRSVERFAEGMAERPVQKDGPRRFDLYRVVPRDRYPDGGDARSLDFPLDQPHGLLADAS